MTKLEQLCQIEGFDDEYAFIEANIIDSVCPGICRTKGCDYTCEVEPDQMEGWCEECSKGSVVSGLVLAGVI